MPQCQNCGTVVSKDYARVFVPDGRTDPRACPYCEDMIRVGGDVREARAPREGNGSEPTQYDEAKAGGA